MRNSRFPIRLKVSACCVIMMLLLLTAGMMTGCKSDRRKYVIAVSQCSDDVWRDKLNDELKTGEYINDSICGQDSFIA